MNGLLCGVDSGFHELPGISTGISMLEYIAACDQYLRTGTHYVADRLVMDAAVDFNAEAELARLADFREQCNFLEGRVDKGLTTEAGVHAHDKNMMNQWKNFIDRGRGPVWQGS